MKKRLEPFPYVTKAQLKCLGALFHLVRTKTAKGAMIERSNCAWRGESELGELPRTRCTFLGLIRQKNSSSYIVLGDFTFLSLSLRKIFLTILLQGVHDPKVL